MTAHTDAVSTEDIVITEHGAGDIRVTVLTFNGAVVRIVPLKTGGQAAYIGNGYVQADDIDDLLTVLQMARRLMTGDG